LSRYLALVTELRASK